MYFRTGVSGMPRKAYAWAQTHTLGTHIETLQVNQVVENRLATS
jgi:hypothetical protein